MKLKPDQEGSKDQKNPYVLPTKNLCKEEIDKYVFQYHHLQNNIKENINFSKLEHSRQLQSHAEKLKSDGFGKKQRKTEVQANHYAEEAGNFK